MDITDNIKSVNEWKPYRSTIMIPDSIKNADLIKIYIYNPSSEKFYVYDFKMSFNWQSINNIPPYFIKM